MTTQSDAPFGREYLQGRIDREFPLARHIGIVVESAEDRGIVLLAPLAPNANFKGTAFGGSLFSIAVLTGWAWITRYLAAHQLSAEAVIQESSIRYRLPVQGDFRSSLAAPSAEHVDKFRKMLRRAGRGRIRLRVDIHYQLAVAAQFDGMFAAAIR
jgi:thioesterase domain-containing protein